MADLTGRLRYLRNAEAMIAVALPAALIAVWADTGRPVAWPLRLGGAALVSALLVQGALYWHLKLAVVEAGCSMPPWFPRLFTSMRRINVAMFAGYAIVLASAAATGASASNRLSPANEPAQTMCCESSKIDRYEPVPWPSCGSK